MITIITRKVDRNVSDTSCPIRTSTIVSEESTWASTNADIDVIPCSHRQADPSNSDLAMTIVLADCIERRSPGCNRYSRVGADITRMSDNTVSQRLCMISAFVVSI